MSECQITREIGIDMGHRVTQHGGKCKNIHGHRYRIEVNVLGRMENQGEEDGMVLDFGFLKELMMTEIDAPCDHGLCLWHKDPLTAKFLGPAYERAYAAAERDQSTLETWDGGKLYVVKFTPTAENLARHWFERLGLPVHERSMGRAWMHNIRVWETPNCSAIYP